MLDGKPLDVYRTYGANCKDAPALPHMVLPGFDQLALDRNADIAMTRFKQFVRSQYGQRKCFVFMFSGEAREYVYKRVRATFGCAQAAEYTSYAAAHGQYDTYIGVHAGDIVKEVDHEDGWAMIHSDVWPYRGWVPLAFLTAEPL